MTTTSFVNGMLTNWASVLPLIQPLVDSGAKSVDFVFSATKQEWCSSAVKLTANFVIKVCTTSFAFLVHDLNLYNRYKGKKNEAFNYQNKKYKAYGLVQVFVNGLSFIFDVLKYSFADNKANDMCFDICDNQSDFEKFKLLLGFENLSLSLVGLGVVIIAYRELIYKNDAEAGNKAREALANGLAAALAKIDPEILEEASQKDLKDTLITVVAESVAEKVASVKELTIIEPAEPTTSIVVHKLAEALLVTSSRALIQALLIMPKRREQLTGQVRLLTQQPKRVKKVASILAAALVSRERQLQEHRIQSVVSEFLNLDDRVDIGNAIHTIVDQIEFVTIQKEPLPTVLTVVKAVLSEVYRQQQLAEEVAGGIPELHVLMSSAAKVAVVLAEALTQAQEPILKATRVVAQEPIGIILRLAEKPIVSAIVEPLPLSPIFKRNAVHARFLIEGHKALGEMPTPAVHTKIQMGAHGVSDSSTRATRRPAALVPREPSPAYRPSRRY